MVIIKKIAPFVFKYTSNVPNIINHFSSWLMIVFMTCNILTTSIVISTKVSKKYIVPEDSIINVLYDDDYVAETLSFLEPIK